MMIKVKEAVAQQTKRKATKLTTETMTFEKHHEIKHNTTGRVKISNSGLDDRKNPITEIEYNMINITRKTQAKRIEIDKPASNAENMYTSD